MIATAIDRVDAAVVALAASLARESEAVDRLVMHMHGIDLLKGAVLMALLAMLWFAEELRQDERRLAVLKTVAAGLIASVASRLLQDLLPSRPRPMNAAADFVAPFGLTADAISKMASWSSFPSDHAALFFALAFGTWLISRPIGAFALLWTALVICAPRVYLGLHYASDIVGGAVLGVATVLVAMRLPDRLLAPLCRIEKRMPGLFYAAGFIFCFELAGLFWDLRSTAAQILESAALLASDL